MQEINIRITGTYFFTFKTCYMNYLENVEKWGNTHHPKWIDILRIILVLFLCWKGIDFCRTKV
jgi:hypothetical protein